MTKLSIKGVAIASSLIWGLAVLFVGAVHVFQPEYGAAFLGMASSIYPGYHAESTWFSVIVGTGYALVDGAIGGAIFAWLYNRFAR